MTSPDAHSGAVNPETTTDGSGGGLSVLWGKGSVIGAVLLISTLGWLALWQMVSDHAVFDGGYGALGPGMALIDDLIRLLGGDGLPQQGLWGDICRAFAVGGQADNGAWPAGTFLIALIMWLVMALAMMLPTALPMITAFDDIRSAAREKGLDDIPGWVFPLGYLVVWAGLAVIAAALQWGISKLLGEEPVFATSAPMVGGVLLVMAGLYQWSALKAACLSQCRSPMRFFMSHWRDGRLGAFRMGLHHGLFCVGCCWAMMALMFVGGTMNLVWMAVLTIVMLLEKVLPQNPDASPISMGGVITNGAGIIFVAWGVVLLLSGLLQIGLF